MKLMEFYFGKKLCIIQECKNKCSQVKTWLHLCSC